jgi:sensor domain CHASE-containing protein
MSAMSELIPVVVGALALVVTALAWWSAGRESRLRQKIAARAKHYAELLKLDE